jgi:hypothetical protein
MGKEYSHKRNRVAKLHAQGLSAWVIHSRLKKEGCLVPIRTIKRWKQQCDKDEGAFLAGPRRSGKSNKGNRTANREHLGPLSLKDRKRLRALAKNNPDVSYRKLTGILPRDISASPSTLQREATKAGLKSFHREKKPSLTVKNEETRLVLAKSTTGFNFRSLVCIDEFTTDLQGSINMHNMQYRAFSKDEVPSIPTSKSSISESRMAVLTPKGGLPLIRVKTNPDQYEMQRIMETVIPLINGKMGEEYCVLHDNSPGWAADSTQQFIAERVPAMFSREQYPGNSPDFNIAEHPIGQLKEAISRANLKTRAELCAFMDAKWAEITTEEKVLHLLDTYPQRMADCIARNGGMTDW